MIHKTKRGKLTNEEKLDFIRFTINIYTKTLDELVEMYSDKLSKYILGRCKGHGFCYLFDFYFNEFGGMKTYLPEIYKYEPKTFFDWENNVTKDSQLYWFPKDSNDERIEIARKMLEDLK